MLMSENSNLPKNRIAELRKTKKLSQAQLAKNTGLTRQAISLYEIGKREPKLETWIKLAKFFEVPIPYLQGISNYTRDDEKELERLAPLIHDKDGKLNEEVLYKFADIEASLSSDDEIKKEFDTANVIIDRLFIQAETRKKYKKIISDSHLANDNNNLPEPLGSYTMLLTFVSEVFFGAQNGDDIAKKILKEIDQSFKEYDELTTQRGYEEYHKKNKNKQ